MHKQLFRTILVLLLALSLALPAFAAEPGLENFTRSTEEVPAYSDVAEDEWYTAVVADASALGLMQGRADGSFDPESGVTVAESLALACRLNDIYYGGSGVFEQGEPWYEVYVTEAVARGIWTEGAPVDYLEPATRGQFAALLCAAFPAEALEAVNEVDFLPDVPEGAAYEEAVYRLYRAGVLTGNDEFGTFYPASGIRRCEVAAIVSRMADPALRRSFTLLVDGYEALLRSVAQSAELSFRNHPAVHALREGDDYYLYSAASESGGERQLRLCAVPAASELDDYLLRVEVRLPHWGGVTQVRVYLEDGTDTMIAGLYAYNASYSFETGKLNLESFWSANTLTAANESAMRRAMQEVGEYYALSLLQWAGERLPALGDFRLSDLGFSG